ncbi:MAG: hypothetical protein M3Y21_06300 [Candidatus Eremiobacteraeota bacterium]|nr:hypothetical protein [Candidatus Eremiobacteraeota bacterium]
MVDRPRSDDIRAEQLTLRYYLIATAIVLLVGSAIALRTHAVHKLHVKSVDVAGSPSAGRNQPASHYHNRAFFGDAAWALSALPECLTQTAEWSGPHESGVLRHLPPKASPIAPNTTLYFHDCTIHVERDQAFVVRGADRFHIPPHTRFWRLGEGLVSLHVRSGAELRIYSPSNL